MATAATGTCSALYLRHLCHPHLSLVGSVRSSRSGNLCLSVASVIFASLKILSHSSLIALSLHSLSFNSISSLLDRLSIKHFVLLDRKPILFQQLDTLLDPVGVDTHGACCEPGLGHVHGLQEVLPDGSGCLETEP